MDAQNPSQKSIFRNPYLYSGILLIVVIVYLAFVFASRRQTNREIERLNAEKAAAQRRADDLAAIQQLGGSDLAIRALYVSPATIHHGESAQLCYDVSNAKTVNLDPAAGEVWPSHDRCLNLSPQKTTNYTLTITDVSGKSVSQMVHLEVR